MYHHFFRILTFFAMKSTIRSERIRQPAAILAVRRFVDASMRTIPQNDEPRSMKDEITKK